MTHARTASAGFGPRIPRRLLPMVGLGLLSLLAGLLAYPAQAAHPEASLPGSNFELDLNANLVVDDAFPSLDWANVDDLRTTDLPTGQTDNSFKGGTKEDTLCPGTTFGSIPNNKSDLRTFGVYSEPGDPGFLHLFWTRVQDPSGTTLMDFELNQSNVDCGNGVNPVRTVGDLLIEYRIEQGGATAQILIREWTGAAWGPEMDLTAVGLASGTINNTAIAAGNADGLGALSARTFGEASLNLDFIFDETECLSFGSAFLKSRSSTSFTSQLKDFIAPIPVNISNCGTIIIEKQTDPDGVEQTFDFTTTGGLNPSTFTLGDDETQTYTDVLAGDYSVTESDGPGELQGIDCSGGTTSVSGSTVDITVAADETVTCTFTNLLKGSLLVEKLDENGERLAGAGFTITPGDIVMNEVSDGLFCTDDLAFGDYTVTESTVPNGYNGGSPQNASVSSTDTCADKLMSMADADVTFTNNPAPGTINIEKTDDAGNPLEGAEFTLYEDDGDGLFAAPPDTAVDTCTTNAAGACSFTDVALGDYFIDETVVPDGHSKDPSLPTGLITVGLGSAPGEGQTINLAFTNPRLHTVIVIVCHEGTATLAASDVDGVLTSIATPPGFATEAELCSLDGISGLPHGPIDITVDVGSDAH